MDYDDVLRALCAAPTPLVVVDAARRVLMMSKEAERLLGKGCSGREIEQCVTTSTRPLLQVAFKEASARLVSYTKEKQASAVNVRVKLLPLEDKSFSGGSFDMRILAWTRRKTAENDDDDAASSHRPPSGVSQAYCTIHLAPSQRESSIVESEMARREAEVQGDVIFKQNADTMPQLVSMATPQGGVMWNSKSFYEYTGTATDELTGSGWREFIHPDDVDEVESTWGHSLQGDVPFETGFRIRRHDGAYRWFLGRALPMKDTKTGSIIRWFGTCTDVHDQITALNNSRRAQKQLESVINHADVTLWAVDREGIITVAQGPGIQALGFMARAEERAEAWTNNRNGAAKRGEEEIGDEQSLSSSQFVKVIGQSIYDVWSMRDIRDKVQRALQGRTSVEEMEYNNRWYRTSFSPMRAPATSVKSLFDGADRQQESPGGSNSDDEIIGVVGASMDITDRKQAQVNMQKSLEERTKAQAGEEAAKEASRLKSEFLANMSHEIRTPIAGIIGLSELLVEESDLTTRQQEYIETIQKSADGLLNVINDVLDFSKVEGGKLVVERVPFRLKEMLKEVWSMFHLTAQAQKKDIDLLTSSQLAHSGKSLLLGDAARLKQIIINLLANSLKFTERGSISFRITQVSAESTALVTIRFEVRDTGCGISPEALAGLFQPFSQADTSTARKFGGTGLGLSICKNLVELMYGRIDMDSVEGESTRTWFEIPFVRSTTQEEGGVQDGSRSSMDTGSRGSKTASPLPAALPVSSNGQTTAHEEVPTHSRSRSRDEIWILIAEDNAVNARIASRNTERMGFQCRVASNGKEAVEEVKSKRYDAILMDCQMPLCDGYEATRLIRASPDVNIRTLPIIALTASAIVGDRERALKAGMNDYLVKPVKRERLEECLCNWIFDVDARRDLAKYVPGPGQ